MDLAREGFLVAQSVSGNCGETVHFAVLDGVEVVYIARVDSIHPVRMVSAVGRRLPAHCTGVGKVLLSSLSADELRRRFGGSSPLPAMTANSITSFRALEVELAKIRQSGVAIDNCESNSDVCCVAAPVFDHQGKVVAALSISLPITRVDESWPGRLAQLIKEGGRELSRRMGYQSTKASVSGKEIGLTDASA
jgi:DNA-binding IclR family transcriptional regulator